MQECIAVVNPLQMTRGEVEAIDDNTALLIG
jgi:hypothetical protein